MYSFTRMWVTRHGPLPEGYEITHLDGDHKNNELANLAINVVGLFDDTFQSKLRRMANHFDDEGLYVKANYCYEIINEMEEKLKALTI